MPKNLVRREAEIFATGIWNGNTFTTADLQEIATNFALLKAKHLPPLKFGHSSNQIMAGQTDGDPALGWVEAVRVSEDGQKLIATIEMPQAVADLIDARMYENVSCEIYFDVELDGKRIGKVLKAVALLGADLPAVTGIAGLRSIAASMQLTGQTHRFTMGKNDQDVQADALQKAVKRKEVEKMELKELSDLVANLALTVKGFSEQVKANADQVAAEKTKREAVETELKNFRAVEAQSKETARTALYQNRRQSVLDKLDVKVKSGDLTPEIRGKFAAEMDKQVASFTAGAELAFSADLVLELAERASAKLSKDRQSRKGEEQTGVDKLAMAVREHVKANPGIQYFAAMQQVIALYPELASQRGEQSETEAA